MGLSFISLVFVSILGFLGFFLGRKKIPSNSFQEQIPLVIGLGLGALIILFGTIDLLINLF